MESSAYKDVRYARWATYKLFLLPCYRRGTADIANVSVWVCLPAHYVHSVWERERGRKQCPECVAAAMQRSACLSARECVDEWTDELAGDKRTEGHGWTTERRTEQEETRPERPDRSGDVGGWVDGSRCAKRMTRDVLWNCT
uniref:DUF4283 domain-containing protein n=1 Tax=Setaria digitata TaxID=48799 RepID=A0A915Q439_9BILA